ncbi:TonB-dependent receptor [Tamlana sp. 62-3]|uniref:TonB-dependent receptor n=1 Tax=Neotamlana sargassicola TaxID=2883125 RepID=A0A9X1L8J9_9FLAO|nr:TonB-dependent receptor [Tamlana sargassicola]MCB4808953.1 TonB-dependent receptor [Tamlana sargassicola]
MKVKLTSSFSSQRKKLLFTIINSFVIFCFFGAPSIHASVNETVIIAQQNQISGVIYDNNGMPLAGATVVEKGTSNGAQTDFDGNFALNLRNANATLVVSYIGFVTKEVAVNNQTTLSITLEEDVSQLEEVVVVGYGTQKKVTLTAAVSQVGTEVFENRPTANAYRSLQGTVPGLVISNTDAGGEPGASSNINIRGFLTANSDGGSAGSIADAGPLVLIDGIEMDLNDIDPEDIESVSVLKDAAAASIYGSQAAAGAIIVTTKSGKNSDGKVKVNYSTSYSITQPSIWQERASPIEFAYTMRDAQVNNLTAESNYFHTDEEFGYILANMANPGSAPTWDVAANGLEYETANAGIGATGATDWEEILLKDWAQRIKHNISLSGGDEKLNFYLSAGLYEEDGFLKVGDESFQRYNLDAKVSSKVNDWLTLELLTKFRKSYTDFPITEQTNSVQWVKERVLDLVNKIKPVVPQYDPIYGSDRISQTYYSFWDTQRFKTENDQIVILPRIIIEPLAGLKFNANLNYKRDNNFQERFLLASDRISPVGFVDAISQEATRYDPTVIVNEYFSPNLFATYDKSINDHNFHATVGFQSEVNKYYSLGASTNYLIDNNIISLNSSLDDDQTVGESITHWATAGVFSRFRYNYKEKYLLEFSYRRDGSSRFAPDDRWAGFPSYSAAYNIAKEDFWPVDQINTFKLRGSYGTLGNQNVGNYLYLSTIDFNQTGTGYLFDGQRQTFSQTPSLTTESLTWETVQTTDIGFDLTAFNNKLDIAFSWYKTDIEGMAAQGADLPIQLGTTAPLSNIGKSRVKGWEVEASWRQQLGDFGYSIRAVLSDYKRTLLEYPNDTNFIGQNGDGLYSGKEFGEIWGYETDGLFQTQAEVDEFFASTTYDSGALTGWSRVAGDIKYIDTNGDGVVNSGTATIGDTGDLKVIGNSTPRYQFSVNLGLTYKNWDFNTLIQGVGKRDYSHRDSQAWRGPAQGPFHAFVWKGHLDYFRADDGTYEGFLDPNPDAYFPNPYSNGAGRNNKNYQRHSTHFLQDASYTRIKSVQLGFTIPQDVTRKFKVDKLRIYATGENLFTFTDFMFYDPEAITSGLVASAQSYPLARVISAGINVSF